MKFKKLKLKLKNEEVEIFLENGDNIFIDREDLELFSKMHWYVIKKRGQSKYLVTNIRNGNEKRRTIGFHQLVLNRGDDKDGFEIDHINRNGLDNRKVNLRIVTHKQNQNNLPKRVLASSKYYGIYYNKQRQVWTAQAQTTTSRSGRTTLGHFKNEEEARIYREQKLDQFPDKLSGYRNFKAS